MGENKWGAVARRGGRFESPSHLKVAQEGREVGAAGGLYEDRYLCWAAGELWSLLVPHWEGTSGFWSERKPARRKTGCELAVEFNLAEDWKLSKKGIGQKRSAGRNFVAIGGHLSYKV